jgi:hypothetical protein
MGIESTVLESIKESFGTGNMTQPKVWFDHGTLWADDLDSVEVDIIKKAIEEVVFASHTGGVEVTKFNPTEREPWTHWAFDI